jgi:hypothetical protein
MVKYEEELDVKHKKKSLEFWLNLFFLILNTPISIYCLLIFMLFLIVGFPSLHFLLGLLGFCGEIIVIRGFILSLRREKNAKKLIASGDLQNNTTEKTEIIELLHGIIGFIMTLIVFAIFLTMEWDLW